MKTFVHKCKIVPLTGSADAAIATVGHALVWVHTDSSDRVEYIVEKHLLDDGWIVDTHEETREVTEDSVRHNAASLAMVRKAIKGGVASEIYAA